ncbi:DUF221-domain-containing protein [Mucor ambiguus]|uniref:DUF221-domain-containing protein n=1 Tax=Mucor ambiguus TaxID=91626 RepID=A0A0C9M5H7_9FUNG|nr:DUF221-domain-containing protein [Mucor ambiguus]
MATIETAYYVPTFLGLSTTFGISCAVSATCIIAFEICKRLDSMKCLFSPRTQLLKNAVPKQPSHLFAWITSTLYIDEKEYIKKVGIDAAMHIRFLRMVVHFLTVQSLFVCPILLALHWTGASASLDKSDLASEFTSLAKNETSDYSATSAHSTNNLYGGFPSVHSNDTDHFRSNSTLYYLSIANIPNRNPIVWVHVVFAFTISLSWLWLLFVNHIHHIDLLQQQPLTNKLHERSVLITHVPHQLRNQSTLQQHFERAQVGVVEHVTLVSNTAIKLVESVLKKRGKAIDNLERWLIHMVHIAQRKHQLSSPKQETVWFDWLSHVKDQQMELCLERQVVQVQQVLGEIDELDKEIARLRDVNRSPEYYMPTGAAFVTFKSAHSAQICAQIVTSWKPGVFDTRMAPEPRDVLWRSLLRRGRKSRVTGTLRQWVVLAAVPHYILAVSHHIYPWFDIYSVTFESLCLSAILSGVFICGAIFYSEYSAHTASDTVYESFAVGEISKQQDFVSYSELEDAVLGRYYHFAIFNVLIVFLLGTTFLTTMLDVLYEPTMIIQLLANALPQGANFFLNYVLFNSSTHAMELIQLGSQIFGHVLFTLPIFSKTPRLRLKYTSPWSFLYYYYYPNHILVLVITLTYSVIQPLIMIFALFYFAFALVVYRHQYMYCYIRRYETNGSRHYRRITRYTSDGLLIFQFTMVGLLYLKGVLAAATTILPLIIFTVWFKVKLNRLFQNRTKHPYIGRFHQVDETNELRRREQELRSTYWWRHVDDVWKFSYIKAWWASGRYAQHSSNNQSTMHLSTLEQHLRESTSVGQSDTNTVVAAPSHHKKSCSTVDISDTVDHKMSYQEHHEDLDHELLVEDKSLTSDHSVIAVEEHYADQYQRYHDFTTYPDDSKSHFDTYEHPALTAPLVSDLILPLNPNLHYWNLKECVYISIDTIRTLFTKQSQPTRSCSKENS